MFTTAMIPTNGIFITRNFAPAGFLVASYDAKGFATSPRWFSTLAAAQIHAAKLG